MKKIINLSLIVIAIGLFFSSCDKTQEIYPSTIPEEGFYIAGSAIYMDSLKLDGLMETGKIQDWEGEWVERDSMFVKFMYVTASGDFAVKQQIEAEAVTFGIEGEWTEEEEGVVWSAKIAKGGNNFSVATDGFYAFIIDLRLEKALLFKIESWNFFGDALVDNDYVIEQVSADKQSAKWAINDVTVTSGEMLFRFYSKNRYPIYEDEAIDSTMYVPTFLGGAFPKPEYGGARFTTFAEEALYNFELTYDFVEGFASTNTMPPYDPRVNTYSLIGDAFYQGNDPANAATAWDVDFNMDFDEASSDIENGIYNFKYNGLYFIADSEFKIRLNGEWDPPAGGNYGYSQVDKVTGDVANIIDAGGDYGNFQTINDAQYDVTFTFDANTYEMAIDFTATQK